MNEALNLLRLGLAKSFVSGPRSPEGWSDASEMVRAHQQVRREHGGAGVAADQRSILSAITSFRRSGAVSGFRDLKYVCLGMGAIDARGWCALAEPKLRAKVGELVEQQSEMRRRMRCFQALLSSYWTFPVNSRTATAEAIEGWREMRTWLGAEWGRLQKSKEYKPPWFEALARHIVLLSDEPCDKYGAALLRGDSSDLNDAMESLAISSDSWVLEEAVFCQMKAAAGLSDEKFKSTLLQLVPIAIGHGGVEVGETLRLRCVAHLVSRYARCNDHPEHMALRDAAISTIGNPWLRRASWDAWVMGARSKPDDQAREMVNGWLKRRLISDFFELLSVDGAGDRRRLDYWLRFEPFIEDMWFALGSDAQYRRGEQFEDFRSRAKGRLLDLEGSTADNNAFVMRIGEYLAVEFGTKGNAFFLFKWDSLDKGLLNILTSGRARAPVRLYTLKSSREKLIHRDSAAQTWEQKFDDYICPLIGRRLADPPRRSRSARRGSIQGPTPTQWNSFVRAHSLRIVDNRDKQGALWIIATDLPRALVVEIEAWGFKRREPKGWFKE